MSVFGDCDRGGMCVATVLSLFIAPILYIIIKTAEARYHKPHQDPPHSDLSSKKPLLAQPLNQG
jgi:hypothetical protein